MIVEKLKTIVKSKTVMIAVISLLIGITMLVFFNKKEEPVAYPVSTKHTISPLNGKPFSLESLKGKVVLVNFWATWCGPCLIEIPDLMALKTTLKDQPFEIIGVSVDDNVKVVERSIKSTKFNYPVVMESEYFKTQFGQQTSIPTTFILNKDFAVVKVIQGYQTPEYILSIIKPLLDSGN